MKPVKWRFLDTGKESAFFNMALDEVILEAVQQGDSPPVFRLFEWEKNALTFGYSQTIADIADIPGCETDGVQFTRRLTGGRAVFHADELAYSVIGQVDDPLFGGNITDTYKSISNVLIDGLKTLGIETELSRGNLSKRAETTDRRSAQCFTAVSKYEILLDGKKIVGSAQRQFRDFFLQQGSIIAGTGQERITDYIKDNGSSTEYQRRLSGDSVDLRTKLNGRFSIGGLKTSLFESFRKTTGAPCVLENPNHEELIRAERLAIEKYNSKEWIFGNGS